MVVKIIFNEEVNVLDIQNAMSNLHFGNWNIHPDSGIDVNACFIVTDIRCGWWFVPFKDRKYKHNVGQDFDFSHVYEFNKSCISKLYM